MLKKSCLIKQIALLVLATFTSTSIAWSAPELPVKTESLNSFALKNLISQFPSEFGSIEKIRNESASQTPSVIVIQDAHAVPEAQRNIKDILKFLKQQNQNLEKPRAFRVWTENASGLLSPDRIGILPEHPQITEQVINDLTERGELSGVELFTLETGEVVAGAEDSNVHRENLYRFQAILKDREKADLVLNLLEVRAKQSVSEACNSKLKNLVLALTARHKNQRELLSYAEFLSQLAKKELGLKLSDSSEQREYPNLSRLLYLNSLDHTFDYETAAGEWAEYLKGISQQPNYSAYRVLFDELTGVFSKKTFTELKREPRWYLESLIAFDPSFEIHKQSFPHLFQAFQFLVLQSEIGAIDLFGEFEQLEHALLDRLITNSQERQVVDAVFELRLIEKLVRAEITRDEFDRWKIANAQGALKMIAPKELSSASNLIDQAVAFYNQAARREEILLHNVLTNVPEKNSPILVLVAGGFHSSGILHFLSKKKISYALIAPKISQIPEANTYREVMLGVNSDFKLSTIFRPLILSQNGDLRVIGAGFERVLRNRLARPDAVRLTDKVRLALRVRSELRSPPPESASEMKVGVVGLDSTGIRFMEDFLNGGAVVNGFDSDADGFKDGEALLRTLLPQSQAGSVRMFPNNGRPDGAFTDKYPGMIEFVRASDVVIINIDPTKKKDPKDYERDIYALASNLARATMRVRKAEANGEHKRKIFVFRSIVPFRGEPTALLQRLNNTFLIEGASDFEIIYQPTFLRRDPSAEEVSREQVVLGTLSGEETEGTRVLRALYARRSHSITVTSARTAELSQYFVTLYLAKKISAFNQLTKLINKVGGDINAVSLVAGLDNRLSTAYSKVGLGFSGWLKRISQVVLERVALRKSEASGVEALVLGELEQILKEILAINDYQTEVLKSQIEKYENQISGKHVVLMGIASRPDSGRFIDSPVLDLIAWFKDRGVQQVSIFDPHVNEREFEEWFQKQREADPGYWSMGVEFIRTESDLQHRLEKSHFAVVGIHHAEIVNLDLNKLATGLDRNILYDGWNIYGLQPDGSEAKKLQEVNSAGINYVSMGRQPIGPRFTRAPLFESKLITRVDDIPLPQAGQESKQIAVLGTGYVGLVQGTELAELGHRVTGADISAEKIEMLNRGESPIYEPGLDDLLKKHRGDRLHFTTDIKAAISQSQAIFIAVGTPSDTDGSIDLSYVVKAARDVGEVIAARKQEQGSIPSNERKIIIIKSTVTPDVFQKISSQLFHDFGLILGQDYALASNPEFLREGQALKDVQFPDRIAFGVDPRMNPDAVRETERFLLEMIRPRMEFLEREAAAVRGEKVPPVRVVITDTISAPLGKYLANSYLASDISFSNVAARAVKFLGGAWLRVARIMRGDSRIARGSFLGAGVGYGGSCFPKDVKALLSFLIRNGVPASFLTLVEDINHWVKEEAFVAQVVESILGEPWDKEIFEKPLQDKQIGIWGLAFKPDTDDVREAPAFDIILGLLSAGAKVVAHDPLGKAVANFVGDIQKSDSVKDAKKRAMLQALKKYLEAGQLVIVQDRYEAARGSDALALLTEWRDYAPRNSQNPNGIDFAELKRLLSEGGRSPIVIAGRDLWSGKEVSDAGINFFAVSQRDRISSSRSELRIGMDTAYVVREISDGFELPKAKLNRILHNFIAQMNAGLSGQKESLAMFHAFAAPPTGKEKGTFLAIDLGGTNLRVLSVELLGNGKWAKPQQLSAKIPSKIKKAKSKEEFFDFIAALIAKFVQQKGLSRMSELNAGFTFSFPMYQTGIASGTLDRWTKGFDVPGMKDQDVVQLLEEALVRKNVTNVRVVALVNDTVGTLATKAYQDPRASVGVILGTGTNGAEWEKILKAIMAINMEWGNFDGVDETPHDLILDRASTNPGRQKLEKQISGMYLGEIVRLILKDLIEHQQLFDGQNSKAFNKPESDKDKKAGFKTAYLPVIVSDRGQLLKTARLLNKLGIKNTRYEDRKVVQQVARFVTKRAARLSAIAILAVIEKNDPRLRREHVAAIDGSLFEKFPAFSRQMKKTLRELRGEKARKIHLRLAKDGSGIGAAIIAAATVSARSELRTISLRKTKRWFKRHKLLAFSLVSLVSLGAWIGYEQWKLSQNVSFQTAAAIQKARGVDLKSKHIPIQFKDAADSGLLKNPFIQESISDALFHIKAVDGGYYGEIASVEIVQNEDLKSREQFPYALRLKDQKFMHGFEKDFEGKALLHGSQEALFADAQNIQALILKGEYDDFMTKKELLPKALVVLTFAIIVLLVAGVIGEVFQIMRRNRIFERHSEARRASDADLKKWAIRRSGQTPPDEKRSELRPLKSRSPLVSGLKALFFIGVAAVVTVIALVLSPVLLVLAFWLRIIRKNTYVRPTVSERQAPDEIDPEMDGRSELRATERSLTRFSQLAKGRFVRHSDHGVGVIEEKRGQIIYVRFHDSQNGRDFTLSLTAASIGYLSWASEIEIAAFRNFVYSVVERRTDASDDEFSRKREFIKQTLARANALPIPKRLPLGFALYDEFRLTGQDSSSMGGLYTTAQKVSEILSQREQGILNWYTANDLERAIILEILGLSTRVHPRVAASTFALQLRENRLQLEAALDPEGKLKSEVKEPAQKRIEHIRRFRQFSGKLQTYIEEAFGNVEIILKNFLREDPVSAFAVAESFEAAPESEVRSELRIVQGAIRLSGGFFPTAEFLRHHHPRLKLNDLVIGEAQVAESSDATSYHAQVIQIIDGAEALNPSLYERSLQALAATNIKLVLLVVNADDRRVSEFNQALRVKAGAAQSRLTIQSVNRMSRELASYVTKQYLSAELREKTAVVSGDPEFLTRVRPGLRFLNDLSASGKHDEALLAVMTAVNQPNSIQDRFGIISLSELLDTKLKVERESTRKVSVSA